jgi:signal peptidase
VTRALVNGAAALVALVVVALLASTLLGVDRYVITGRSMGSAVPVGSLVLGRAVAAADVHRGDIITFRPPGFAQEVTHRVIGADGRGIVTRGDANAAADPWRLGAGVSLRRVVAHVPDAGYAVAALRTPALLGLLVAAMAGAAGLWLIAGAGGGARRRDRTGSVAA